MNSLQILPAIHIRILLNVKRKLTSVYIHSALGRDGRCFATLCNANKRSPLYWGEGGRGKHKLGCCYHSTNTHRRTRQIKAWHVACVESLC
jgi:hypothetical protein